MTSADFVLLRKSQFDAVLITFHESVL